MVEVTSIVSTTVPPPTIDTVILDFGGVVVDWDMRHLFRTVFDDRDEMETFLSTVLTPAENFRCDLGVPIAEVVGGLVDRHPAHRLPLEAWRDRWVETVPSTIDGIEDLIDEIRSAGLGLYGLSNFSAETFPLAQARHPVFEQFDGIVISGEAGVAKPQPEIYHLICERYGVEMSRSVFVDDSPVNVQGARAVGMTAVHFTDVTALRRELEALGIELP